MMKCIVLALMMIQVCHGFLPRLPSTPLQTMVTTKAIADGIMATVTEEVFSINNNMFFTNSHGNGDLVCMGLLCALIYTKINTELQPTKKDKWENMMRFSKMKKLTYIMIISALIIFERNVENVI